MMYFAHASIGKTRNRIKTKGLANFSVLTLISVLLLGCKLDTPTIWQDPQFTVQTTSDVKYGEGLSHSDWNSSDAESMDLLLDMYQPRDISTKRPAVVFIHGGGFIGGDKTTGTAIRFMDYFVSRGFVGFSINYRVAGDFGTLPSGYAAVVDAIPDLTDKQRMQAKAMYPAGRDAKAAIRWIYANAETLNINPDHIAVIGGSAGSFITMALGNTNPEDYKDELTEAEDPTLATTNLESDSSVHTLIDHWGGPAMVDLPEMFDDISRWNENNVPVSIVHGTEDPTVAFEEGLAIVDHYKETGVRYEFYPLEGIGHGAWNVEIDGQSLYELAFDFVVDVQDLTFSEQAPE
ncbi:MAG: alpha/beta hydrolase [Pseudomonadales bacterium]|nr:alpha/beta hydrolase [Pseudomonadales bacterium]